MMRQPEWKAYCQEWGLAIVVCAIWVGFAAVLGLSKSYMVAMGFAAAIGQAVLRLASFRSGQDDPYGFFLPTYISKEQERDLQDRWTESTDSLLADFHAAGLLLPEERHPLPREQADQ